MGGDQRWRWLARLMTAGLPVVFCLIAAVLWVISRDLGYALIGAALMGGNSAFTLVMVARVAWAGHPATGRRLGLILGLFGLQLGLAAALLLIAWGVPV